jgi:outer membrane biosynthesis protein TonB
MLLSLTLLFGCGESPPPAAVPAPAPARPVSAPKADAPKPEAAKSEAPKAAPRPARKERPPAERAKVAQLFQVPQVTRSNTIAYSDSRQEGNAAPQIRLLGFSRLDGQLRALVQVKGETLPVEQGDIINGIEVVSVDEDGVSFQHAGQRWTSRLFEKLESPPVVVARAAHASSAGTSGQDAPMVESSLHSTN